MKTTYVAIALIGLIAITSGCMDGGDDTSEQTAPEEPESFEEEEQLPEEEEDTELEDQDPEDLDEFE